MLARTLSTAVAGSLLVVTGCSVDLTAPRLTVDLLVDGMEIAQNEDARVPVGETVVVVNNQSDDDVRLLLLEDAPPLDALPDEVLKADSGRDSDLVVAAKPEVEKRENLLAKGGLGYVVHSASFHVHFAEGRRYTLVAVSDRGAVRGLEVVAGTQP